MDYVQYQRAKWDAAYRDTTRQIGAQIRPTYGIVALGAEPEVEMVEGAGAVDEFLDYKRKFLNLRGQGGRIATTGKAFPATTWKDVYNFGLYFYNVTQKTGIGVFEQAARELASMFGAGPTNSFANASAAWRESFPFPKLVAQHGFVLAAEKLPGVMYTEVGDAPYPWNEEFWRLGGAYAIARDALGGIPSHTKFLVESVKEALDELPGNVTGALPSPAVMPNFSLLGQLIEWSIYGGIALLLWWALKPKKGRP
jgi:hypothetical protein